MDDLVVGLGLVLVIEGLVWALVPGLGRRMLEVAAEMPETSLRTAGAIAIGAGVVIVWFVRG